MGVSSVKEILDAAELDQVLTAFIYHDLNQPRKFYRLETIERLFQSILEAKGLIKAITLERITQERIAGDRNLEAMLRKVNGIIGKDFIKYNREHYRQEGLEHLLKRDFRTGDPDHNGDVYLIVCGHRRFEAHYRFGIPRISSKIVEQLTPLQRLQIQIAEDSQESFLPHEAAYGILEAHRMLVGMEMAKDDGRPENITFTMVAGITSRTLSEVARAFNFGQLHRNIQQAIVDEQFPYAFGTEIGRLANRTVQWEIYQMARDEKHPKLSWLRKLVDTYAYREKPFISPEIIARIEAEAAAFRDGIADVAEPAQSVKVYRQQALSEIRGCLGLGEAESQGILTPDAVRFLQGEVKGMRVPAKELYLRRSAPNLSAQIHHELKEAAAEKNLAGQAVDSAPKRLAKEHNEREELLKLMNGVYRKMAAMGLMLETDRGLRGSLRKQKSLEGILKGFGEGIELYEGRLFRKTAPPEEEPTEQIEGFMYRGEVSGLANLDYDLERFKQGREISMVPLEMLREVSNIRRLYRKKGIENLSGSMDEVGQIEELFVVSVKEHDEVVAYDIVCGHRRLRALKGSSLKYAKCFVVDDLSPMQRLILQLIEDSQEHFTPSERASSWYRLYQGMSLECQEKRQAIPTIGDFAKRMGLEAGQVRKGFAYLSLPEGVRSLVDLNVLPYSTAIEISYLPTKYSQVMRNYRFDPDDFFVTPEQMFKAGASKWNKLQVSIALHAAYNQIPGDGVVKIINEHNPNQDDGLFSVSAPDTLKTNTRTRDAIAADMLKTLALFKPNMGAILSREIDDDYLTRVLNHRWVVQKAMELKREYTGFRERVLG